MAFLHYKRLPGLTFAIISGSITSLTFAQTNQPIATSSNEATTTSNTIDTNQVLECSKVNNNVARLACFDKVVSGDDVFAKKQPLDLVKTINTSLQERKAVPILVPDTTSNEEGTTTTIAVAAPDDKPVTAVSQPTPKLPSIDRHDKEILEKVGVDSSEVTHYTPLSVLYDLDRNDPKGILTLRPHLPMYVMPIWYSATPNYDIHTPTQKNVHASGDQLQNLDTKMQISLKTKIMEDVFNTNADVWFGYTQQSYWQLYNRHSRPFRSSDYQPELFITQPVTAKLPFGGSLRMLGAGVLHQSNGQSNPLSRSWNRAYVMGGTEWGNLTVVPRLWLIAKENKKDSDNPDIADFMGYGDIRWLYDFGDRSTVGGVFRYNPSTQNGAVQIDYAYPISGGMKAYIQLFHGYGENVQDYNHKNTNVGIGLMFNDFKGL